MLFAIAKMIQEMKLSARVRSSAARTISKGRTIIISNAKTEIRRTDGRARGEARSAQFRQDWIRNKDESAEFVLLMQEDRGTWLSFIVDTQTSANQQCFAIFSFDSLIFEWLSSKVWSNKNREGADWTRSGSKNLWRLPMRLNQMLGMLIVRFAII